MKLMSWLVILLAALLNLPPIAAQSQEFLLWPQGAPNQHGTSTEDLPAITAYLPPPKQRTGAGVLVVPGGSFLIRCVDNEGVQVARWLNRHGVAAFVVRYRLLPRYTMKEEFQDVRRAMQFVRARANSFGVAENRIGIIGFSAGSRLAANVAMKPLAAKSNADDEVERVSSRPNYLITVYADAGQRNEAPTGLTKLFQEMNSAEDWAEATVVTEAQLAATPPTFMFCTSEDGAATGMADLYGRLLKNKIPTEAHFFRNGPHGVALAPGDPVLGEWPKLMFTWMQASGYLTDAPRVALRGSVQVDDKPLELGYLVLKPIDAPTAPPVTVHIANRSGETGAFAVPVEKGPTPGRYRIEVHQQAKNWVSVFKDPVLNRLREKLSANHPISADDQREWLESARTKTFAPTLEDERVFSRTRPNSVSTLSVEIKRQSEQALDIKVFSR